MYIYRYHDSTIIANVLRSFCGLEKVISAMIVINSCYNYRAIPETSQLRLNTPSKYSVRGFGTQKYVRGQNLGDSSGSKRKAKATMTSESR